MLRHRSFAVSSTRVLALVLLQGVCVWSEDITGKTVGLSGVVGESVVLPSGYKKEDAKFAEWAFEGKLIVEYLQNGTGVCHEPQLKDTLETNLHNFSLTVKKLRQEHSGTFQLTATNRRTGQQFPTTTFKLQVYKSTLKVNITQNVTIQNNTCMISLICSASGPPGATFSWTGHRTGSGASVDFPLSPADGSVKLKCSAQRRGNHIEKDEKEVVIKCDNKTSNGSTTPEVVNPTQPPETDVLWYVYYVGIPAGAGFIAVLLAIAVGVCCYRKHRAKGSEDNTCYADVTVGRKSPPRSVSVTNEMSIYETVDERAVGIHNTPQPQTLYDRVNFSRPAGKKAVCATGSSPYQEVL